MRRAIPILLLCLLVLPRSAGAEDIYCRIDPHRPRGQDVPVAEQISIRLRGSEVLVMDDILAMGTDLPLEGQLVRSDSARLVVSWSVPLTFQGGETELMRSVLSLDRATGRASVTSTFDFAANRFWGRGRCATQDAPEAPEAP